MARPRWAGSPGRTLAGLSLALAVLLFLEGAARSPGGAGHEIMFGPYSPLRSAYLLALLAIGAVLVGSLREGTPRLGVATLVGAAMIAAAALAAAAGYLDAVLLQDWTLIRLPPTEETGNGLATYVSFLRVSIVLLAAFLGAVVLAVESVQKRGEPLVGWTRRRSSEIVDGSRAALVRLVGLGAGRQTVTIGALALVVLVVDVLGFRFQGGDRATFNVVGRLILDGRLLYRDVWDIKFPGIYYVSAGFQMAERWGGRAGLPKDLASGALEALFTVLTIVAFHRLGREFLPPVRAGLATVVFAVMTGDPTLTAGGHMTETYVMLPSILACLSAVRFLTGPPAPGRALAVGFWSALASMIRPQAVMPLAAFGATAWLQTASRRSGAGAGRAAIATGLGALGFAMSWAALLLYFFSKGTLSDFYGLAIGFNRFAARAFPVTNRLAAVVAAGNYIAALLPVIGVGVVVVTRIAIRRWRSAAAAGWGRWAFLLILAAGEMLGFVGIGRVAFHYLLEAVPALCLILGVGLSWRPVGGRHAPRWAVAGIGAVLLFQVTAGYVLYLSRPWAVVPGIGSILPVAAFVRSHTEPGDRIFVAGTSQAEAVYYYADRPPASRYLYVENAVAAYTEGRYLGEIERALSGSPPRLLVVDPSDRWYDGTNRIDRPVTRYIEANFALSAHVRTPGVTWSIFEPRAVRR